MVVVGVLNTDRNRDLTPRKVEGLKNSGGADAFLEFVALELDPFWPPRRDKCLVFRYDLSEKIPETAL